MSFPASNTAAMISSPRSVLARPRVMIVDDSVVVRGLVSRWVEEDSGLEFAGKFSNGLKAVEGVVAANPDVIILDIEMPVMNGLEALPKLIKAVPGAKVIMPSTLTQRNADISLQALSLGAADYCPKPVSNSGVSTSVEFKKELLSKVHAIAPRRRQTVQPTKVTTPLPSSPSPARPVTATATAEDVESSDKLKLRPFSTVRPRILVIGSSTGGPPAVIKVLTEIKPIIKYLPILITQHMPLTFTGIFANHIGKAIDIETKEARDGEPALSGRVYVAPGGQHMIMDRNGSKPIIRLTDGPDINFCKPAVDPLFETASKIYGPAVLACVLTGMGSDGANGAVRVADAGGSVIAQDEATSVVWGMPGATAKAGACSAILPLSKIAEQIKVLVEGRPS